MTLLFAVALDYALTFCFCADRYIDLLPSSTLSVHTLLFASGISDEWLVICHS
jgi:hypothetical protein